MIVTVFCESIRPIEHILGLALVASINPNYEIHFVRPNDDCRARLADFSAKSSNISIVDDVSLLLLKRIAISNLIFGSAQGWLRYAHRLCGLVHRKQISVSLRPGKVTKPSGRIGQPSRYKSLLLETAHILSYYLFKRVTLVTDVSDLEYCSSAYCSLTKVFIKYPSPKYVYMSSIEFKRGQQKVLLFCPTHRSNREPSPIDNLLMCPDFVRKLRNFGFDIMYTTHSSGFDIGNQGISGVKSFDGSWSNVRCLVTDYSSIGADFAYLGGETVYYVPDYDNFFVTEEIDYFFRREMLQSKHCHTVSELYQLINPMSNDGKILKLISPICYLDQLVEHAK